MSALGVLPGASSTVFAMRQFSPSPALLPVAAGLIAALLLSVPGNEALRFGLAAVTGLILLVLLRAHLKLRVEHSEFSVAIERLKTAKEAAENSEKRFRKLMEMSPFAILIGRDGRFLTANEEAARLFRVRSPKELAGRRLEDFVAPEFRALVEQERDQLFSIEMRSPPREMRLMCGGEVVDVEIAGASCVDNTGTTVQATIRDITDRKKAEESLRQSETRLRAIADSAKDAIVMMDPAGKISFWNPAAQAILGYSCEEAIGKNLHSLLAPRRYLDIHDTEFHEFLLTSRGKAIGKTLELPALNKDGREIMVDLSLSAMRLDGAWHAVGILRDVTRRKQAEQALKESEEKFRQLAENIREVFFVFEPQANRPIYVSPAYEQIWDVPARASMRTRIPGRRHCIPTMPVEFAHWLPGGSTESRRCGSIAYSLRRDRRNGSSAVLFRCVTKRANSFALSASPRRLRNGSATKRS